MEIEKKDDTTVDQTTSDPSADTTGSSDAGGRDTNADEKVSITRAEYERLQNENESKTRALQKERGRKMSRGLSAEPTEEAPKPKRPDVNMDEWYANKRLKEMQDDLVDYERNAVDQVVKRFPKVGASNSVGINEDIVDAYQTLMKGQIAKGRYPKSQKDVSDLLDKAIRMTYTDLYISEARAQDDVNDYKGLASGARGGSYEPVVEGKGEVKPRNNEEKKFADAMDAEFNQTANALKGRRGQ